MHFSSLKEFTVIMLSPDCIRGGIFTRTGQHITLKSWNSQSPTQGETESDCLKRTLRLLGYRKGCPIVLGGALADGVFFHYLSTPLPPGAMKNALSFELPQRVLAENPAEWQVQFLVMDYPVQAENASSESVNLLPVNAYAFPREGMDELLKILAQSSLKIDYYLYPLLGLQKEDTALYLPDLEPDFFFADGEWHPKEALPSDWKNNWSDSFRRSFVIPETDQFPMEDFFACLLLARTVCSKTFSTEHAGVNVLPTRIRPRRLRNQLRLMGILLAILVGCVLWSVGESLLKNRKEYADLLAERNRLQTQSSQLQERLKKSEKEIRDITRVLNVSAGEYNLLDRLGGVSSVLPSNVMVTSFRFNDGNIDLMLRSEAESLNISTLFSPLKHWKVTNLQERRRNNDAASTITLRLVPAEGGNK